MKFYSKISLNIISLFFTIIIYIFLVNYVPKLYKVGNSYLYYKFQPNIVEEYED